MIRFGAIVTVVVAAVGLLAVGAVAGDLTLVYVSIALAAVALLLLIVGVAVWRDEVFASSARRDNRDLAPVGVVGRAGRAATGPGAVEGWPERPAPTPWPGPTAGAGLGRPGGDTREFAAPAGAPPDRDAPGERDRRSAEPRPTEQLPRPADAAGRPGREVRRRERPGREAATEDWRGRDPAALDRPGRDPAPDERSAPEAAAGDRAARETVSAHRPDRVRQYPTVFGPERYESADDPTRLAHRLDSLADFGRQADLDATGSARSRPGRPGGQRHPAPIDPLTGPADERRSAAEPLAAAPPTGRAAMRATGPEQGTGAADAPEPSRAVSQAPVSPAPASATPVSGATAPGTTAPATAKDLGSRSPVPPAESGLGRPGSGRDRSDNLAAESPGGSVAWPRVPGADPRLPAEAAYAAAASAAAAGLVLPATPERVPASHDEGPGTASRSAAAPPAAAAMSAPPAPPAAAGAPVGAAAASEPDASAGTSPAEPAPGAATTDGGAAARPAIGLDDQVSVVPGIARYHKADCILIRFLSDDDLEVMSRRNAEAADCAPCRACRPDRPSESD
jgi:hypothetical protein